jgi:hypothetical protein
MRYAGECTDEIECCADVDPRAPAAICPRQLRRRARGCANRSRASRVGVATIAQMRYKRGIANGLAED